MRTHLPRPTSSASVRAGGLRVLAILLVVCSLGLGAEAALSADFGLFVFASVLMIFAGAASRSADGASASSRSPSAPDA